MSQLLDKYMLMDTRTSFSSAFANIKRSERRIDMSCVTRKPITWFPNRSDTNELYKMVRDGTFWIKKGEDLYYPYSENKGTDHVRSYFEADLRLCFRA